MITYHCQKSVGENINNNIDILDFFISLHKIKLYPKKTILIPAIPAQKNILIEYRPNTGSKIMVYNKKIENYSTNEISLIARYFILTLLDVDIDIDIDIDIDNILTEETVIGKNNGYFNYKSKLINYNILATRNLKESIDINISLL